MSANGMRDYSLKEWCGRLGNNIEIPLIQRGFVWKAEQIAGLWDSLLRGFPIGSFMVQPKGVGSEAVDLIDGQQRGRSIAGGVNFKCKNGFRVWIACQYNQSNPEFKFDIKVTTDKHPFGFDNKFKKLSVSQRSKAFKISLCQKYLPEEEVTEENSLEDIIHRIKLKNSNQDIHISLEYTKPYSPRTKYIALDVLFDAINNGGDNSSFEIIKKAFKANIDSSELDEKILKEITDALMLLLEKRSFYAIEVERHLHNETGKAKDIDIEVLFKRVGTGGTALSDLDFAYSLIKQRLGGAQDYINGLLGENEISSLFSSLDCVDMLIRTSCFEAFLRQPTDGTNTLDTSDSFKSNKKILNKKIDANERVIEDLFISKKINGCLSDVVSYLKFDDKSNPYGLPIQLLQKIPKKLWQMFVILSYSERFLTKEDKDLPKVFVRITLYWLLIAPTSDETAKIVHQFINLIKKTISDKQEDSFYFEQELIGLIHKTSRKNNVSFARLLSQSTFTELTVSDSDLFEPTNIISKKYKLDADERYLIGMLFWWNKNLLLWLQRDYIHKLNSDLGLKIFSDITLYDFDHIIPQHLWAGTSNVARKFKDKYFRNEGHWEIGNSIGNYQLLKFSDNRAKKSATYDNWMESLNDSKNEVLVDSLLINSDQYFSHTVKKNKNWSDEQRINFVKAVETRVNDLYAEFLTIYDEDSIYFERE